MTPHPLLPAVGTLWCSRADTSGRDGLFALRQVYEAVIGHGRNVVPMVRLERDDGAVFDVTVAVLLADFAALGAWALAAWMVTP